MAVLLEDQVKALEKNTPKVVLTVLIIAEIMILVMGKEQNT